MDKRTKLGAYTSIALIALLGGSQAKAAGFALNDQSVTYLGNAYAGTVSATQDGSTAYYNPAGMNQLKDSQLVASDTYINDRIKLYATQATSNGGFTVLGNNPTRPKANLNLPEGHIVWRAHKDFSLGFSIVEPFNLNTRYSYSDIAHVAALQNKIVVVDFSPSLAIRIHPCLSIGAALDIIKTNTLFSSGISWGLGAERDGLVTMGAHDWSMGYHLGLLLKVGRGTQVGLAYFSRLNPKFDGIVTGSVTTDMNGTGTVKYNLRLPDHINAGVTHKLDRQWTLLSEVEWTHWNRLQNITMTYNIPGMAPALLPGSYNLNLRNTWRFSVGLDYNIVPPVTLKAGFGFDQSPVRDLYRTAMLPDSNRLIFGLGARFTFNKNFAVVAGYSHTSFKTASINQTSAQGSLNQVSGVQDLSQLSGSIKRSINTFGVQVVLGLD